MGRFRSSSLGSGAIILAFLLLLLHRYGTGLLFLVVGAALLWYGRTQREARERAEQRASQADGDGSAEDGRERGEADPPPSEDAAAPDERTGGGSGSP